VSGAYSFFGGTGLESIFISIALGITLGCLDVFSYNRKKIMNRLSTLALFVMLWCLGAKIGCDRELLESLGLLGYRAVIVACGVIMGSLVFLWVVTKLFADVIKQEEEGGTS